MNNNNEQIKKQKQQIREDLIDNGLIKELLPEEKFGKGFAELFLGIKL